MRTAPSPIVVSTQGCCCIFALDPAQCCGTRAHSCNSDKNSRSFARFVFAQFVFCIIQEFMRTRTFLLCFSLAWAQSVSFGSRSGAQARCAPAISPCLVSKGPVQKNGKTVHSFKGNTQENASTALEEIILGSSASASAVLQKRSTFRWLH